MPSRLRSTRKIALTPAGEAYLEFARRAVREIADGMEQVRSLESDLTGTLRITAPVSWGQKVLAKHLPEFLRLHPALAIELKLTDRIMDLANERIDVALRWSKAPTQEISSTHINNLWAGASFIMTIRASRAASWGVPEVEQY